MSALVGVAAALTALMVAAAVALTIARMLRGPGTADRAVALDLLGMIAVSGCGLLALGIGNIALLDIGLGLGLVGFISAIAMAGLMARAPQRALRGREAAEDDPAREETPR
ncbi:MAG: monovalent cation/H+ antiporter complex subunit F [Acetobacteraceae bacterium]|nr:monovalent cation/H+ antiporter complex subunit F [Acetobacteraceae bacterium]MDW8399853.1 monovalent cation/H+ antiporter complex subunit F [Acetobacteraceae bacterium]